MRTPISLLSVALLLGACGSARQTAQVRDDVYDIPDRTVVASVGGGASTEAPTRPAQDSDDYYSESEASRYQQGSYWDRTYGQPSWYGRGRFGFGYYNPYSYNWGPNYGPGWYDPYWSNSWQSGYGYYSPWYGGMYDPWYNNSWGYNGWGYGGGCGYGYGSYWGMGYYGSGWGGYYGYGCPGYGFYGYPGYGYGYGYGGGWYPGHGYFGGTGDAGHQSVVVAPRPSLNGGAAGITSPGGMPRSRTNFSLLDQVAKERVPTMREPVTVRPSAGGRDRVPISIERDRPVYRDRTPQPERTRERYERPTQPRERTREFTPQQDRGGWDRGGGFDGGGSRGGGGGGVSPSPRPRR